MNSFSRIIALFLGMALLPACGLKGPLYMPPPEPSEKPAAPQQTQKPEGKAAPNASQPTPQAPAITK